MLDRQSLSDCFEGACCLLPRSTIFEKEGHRDDVRKMTPNKLWLHMLTQQGRGGNDVVPRDPTKTNTHSCQQLEHAPFFDVMILLFVIAKEAKSQEQIRVEA